MSSPGWFPDPAGDPNLQRYWDGTQWTPATRPPPVEESSNTPSWPELTPHAPEPWAQEQPPKRRTGLIVGLVVAVVLLAGGGTVAAMALTGGDSDPSADPSNSAPSDPSASTTEVVPLASCPVYDTEQTRPAGDGRAHGGDLSFPLPKGYRMAPREGAGYPWAFPWATDYQIAQRPTPKKNWYALMSVGSLPTDGGYTTLEQTAESLVGCVARDEVWFKFASLEPLESDEREIDGHPGWVSSVNVTPDESPFKALLVMVAVVDTGKDDEYSVFIASVNNEDKYSEFREQATWAMKRLKVD